jgi:hypothetical protein
VNPERELEPVTVVCAERGSRVLDALSGDVAIRRPA